VRAEQSYVNLLGSLALFEREVDFDLDQSQTFAPQWFESRVFIENRFMTHNFERGVDC
jgi:hypothetical protein